MTPLCCPENIKKGYYPAKCPECGFTACSSEWVTNQQISEDANSTCPICFTDKEPEEIDSNSIQGSDFALGALAD